MLYFQHDFSHFNEENLLNDFANLDLTFFDGSPLDVSTKFNRLLSFLDDLMKTHVPLEKVIETDIKFRNKPWINGKIQKMMYIRDQILRKLKKNISPLLIFKNSLEIKFQFL